MDTDYKILIKPQKGWIGINFKELWLYKELFYIFVWRDIKVRYKQTTIGIAWALLQPLLMMIIFSIFFGALAKVPSDYAPYPIFVYAGLLFWNYFSLALTNSSNSLIDNENILKKIYFPRLILPLASAITPLVDLFLSLIVFTGLMVFHRFTPTLMGILLFPLLILITFLSVSGLGMFLSSINVRYRDIRYALPFVIQLLFFVTPVIYPATLIPSKYQWIISLNPMTGIIETARAGIIGNNPINYHLLFFAAVISIGLFILGIFYFRKNEKIYADVS